MGLLSFVIWLPVFLGGIIFSFGHAWKKSMVRWFALISALLAFFSTLPLYFWFEKKSAGIQFMEKKLWIEKLNINYYIGLDGLSLWFVVLTAFITVVVVAAAWDAVEEKSHQYMGAFLVLSGLMIGVFSALDALLFYVFFEATLIPMYIVIGVWGGPNRIYAAFKFFLYTLLGSLLMLIALIYMYGASGGSFDILSWHSVPLSSTAQSLLFFAFFAAFAVKVPMWPVHTWLPDVHVEAPTGGSAVLAAIMLKLGAYGFLRFSLPILPDASREWAWLMITLSLVAVIYVGLVAIVQQDMKKLVAYSSVAHMGFVTLGFFIFNNLGMTGAVLQMISHGFVSAAMFLCIGVLYDRMHSREISDYGGVANRMPRFAALALLFFMANCGLPGTAGFVGEWSVILGAVQFDFWVGFLSATALVLGASYSLWMYKRVYFGEVVSEQVSVLKDVNAREFFVLLLLALCTLWMGIYPRPFSEVIEPSVQKLLMQVSVSKLS